MFCLSDDRTFYCDSSDRRENCAVTCNRPHRQRGVPAGRCERERAMAAPAASCSASSYAESARRVFDCFAESRQRLTPSGWLALCDATGLAGYLPETRLREIFDTAIEGCGPGSNAAQRSRAGLSRAGFGKALALSSIAVCDKQWEVRSSAACELNTQTWEPSASRSRSRWSMRARGARGSTTAARTPKSPALRSRRRSRCARCSMQWDLLTLPSSASGWPLRPRPLRHRRWETHRPVCTRRGQLQRAMVQLGRLRTSPLHSLPRTHSQQRRGQCRRGSCECVSL